MKRALYTVADEEFATLLARTNKSLKEDIKNHMFVGGVAAQTHIANYLCRIFNRSLMELANSDSVRLQDYLRATDDVDVALRMQRDSENGKGKGELEVRKRILSILDRIVGEGEFFSPTEEHIISINLHRRGHVKPVFQLGVDGRTDSDRLVAFNLYRRPKDLDDSALREFEARFYKNFLDRAEDVDIPYGENSEGKAYLKLRVLNPADLLATKIVRGREKDVADALSLSRYSEEAGMPISEGAVRAVLFDRENRLGIPNKVLTERYGSFMRLKEATAGSGIRKAQEE